MRLLLVRMPKFHFLKRGRNAGSEPAMMPSAGSKTVRTAMSLLCNGQENNLWSSFYEHRSKREEVKRKTHRVS